MKNRSKLQKEKNKLLSRVNILTSDAESQNQAYNKLHLKMLRMEREMAEIKKKMGKEGDSIPQEGNSDDIAREETL